MTGMDFQVVGITVALSIVILTLFLYFVYRSTLSSRRGVMIAGVSNCGKTLLFTRLVHKKFTETYVSIAENVAEFQTERGTLSIIDIPGHDRLREKFLEQYKKSCRAVVYVIDSVTFQKEIQDIAEFLYIILTDPVVVKNCKNLLILCNKQDQFTAKGWTVIKEFLENELNTVRMTKSSQLSSIAESESKSVFLGHQDKNFEFSHCQMKVDFLECYAFKNDSSTPPNLGKLESWLESVA